MRGSRPRPTNSGVCAALLLVLVACATRPEKSFPETVARPVGPLSVDNLKCEYKADPIGIDASRPRLSWQLASAGRGVVQSAYELQVATSLESLQNEADLLLATGRVASSQSIHVEYSGPPCTSRTRYHWRVRVWDGQGRGSQWSRPAYWEMGQLDSADWAASWIVPDLPPGNLRRSPMLRSTFEVEGEVESARAYVSSLGLYEARINGLRVGDQLFTPGWTSYDRRLQYQTYDVTELLNSGPNAVGATVGDGWYRGYNAWRKSFDFYGDQSALLLEIRIRYVDGREQVVGTDSGWTCAKGPILSSDIYLGETYDARLEKPGWTRSGFDDRSWSGVHLLEHSKSILVAPAGPPVRRMQEIRPVSILPAPNGEPNGEVVVDMGQNMVGWVRLRVRGDAGTRVVLRHAEVLDAVGNLYTTNLRTAAQRDEYVLRGSGEEVFEPHFTYHGFRYVSVSGYPGELTPEDLTGVVIHSDMAETGEFETSSPRINQLHQNILWSQKGNSLVVPTDCPQRDERMGWTGDAQVFAGTAAFNMDVASFYTAWLRDLSAEQRADGSIPFVVPDFLTRGEANVPSSSVWGDASVIVPWTLYLRYGDTRVLEEQYDTMRSWVEYVRSQAGEDLVWDTGFHFGDWIAFHSQDPGYPGASTSPALIATAYFAHACAILRDTAWLTGRRAQWEEYSQLRESVAAAFRREFITQTGRVGGGTQTAYALALQFDLVPEALRESAAAHLRADVQRHDSHPTTGFAGISHLHRALSENGHVDVAYDLLNQDTSPSWLYAVDRGATTVWERWDGIAPDGSILAGGMNSFNHSVFGSVGDWMYSVVAGIKPDPKEPGYRHVRIEPLPGGGLTRAAARLDSPYGLIESSWSILAGQLTLDVVVPPNAHATIRLPTARLDDVEEDGAAMPGRAGIVRSTQVDDAVVVEVLSGAYSFRYPWSGEGRPREALSLETPLRLLFQDHRVRDLVRERVPSIPPYPQVIRLMDLNLLQLAEYLSIPRAVLENLDRELRRL